MLTKPNISHISRSIAIAFLLMALPLVMLLSPTEGDQAEMDLNSWTFIVYMSADVPGSPLNWTADINEMENGLLRSELTVVAMVDPEGLGDTRAYVIEHDEQNSSDIISEELTQLPFLQGTSEAEMGEPETLIDFADFVLDNFYQGGRVAIIFWGHGNGWYGVSQDRGDILDPQEMVEALSAVSNQLNRKIDLVIFDACNMGNLEVLSSLTECVQYSISSEIPIPSYGLPYDTILARISIDPSMSTEEIGKAFTEEYVEYGALISGITSQAAIIDLQMLENATADFKLFVENCSDFIPISKELFERARNESGEVDGGSTIDVISYLLAIENDVQSPRRLAHLAEQSREMLSTAILSNNVYYGLSYPDYPKILYGLSLFYPYVIVPSQQYANTSEIATIWKDFLTKLKDNTTYAMPIPNLILTMEDLRFDDGLEDTVILQWYDTQEISFWDFEILCDKDDQLISIEDVNDSESGLTIYYLEPEFYEIFAYGCGQNGEYRWYGIFESIQVMRRYFYTVDLSKIATDSQAQLTMINLRTEKGYSINVSGDAAIITFDTPDPHHFGDRIALNLKVGEETVGNGLIVLGNNTDSVISLNTRPELSSIVQFSLIILVSGLLIFSFIMIMRVGEENGFGLRGLKKKNAAKKFSSQSDSPSNREVQKQFEQISSAADVESKYRRK